ncbi:hypothetical protein ThrDRAFT_03229 [Frankia casuarinae]|uniref:hypothetical protein n=1 Tax=Frankia TaxID=1854 RepID=UPI00044AA08A|nr:MULTISPECIES: hypothetical protein [Frankia]EYT91127.1 hypothetical protein ThrDRAFT_03229 [Frankia casuarinae]KDA41624.1 hypothetical protein BMG523Draft_03562 [Frankia sp. BMG5.23]TFE27409.1 hypothetical protein E0F15_16495 [Frankia sp. B2]
MRRLGVLLALAHLWWTNLHQRAAEDGRDRGDALPTAVIAVGLVLIAALVIVILRAKATEVAEHVCTSADPTTCQ